MKTTLEDNDPPFASRMPGKLDAGFDGLRSAVREEEAIDFFGCDPFQLPGQFCRDRRNDYIHLAKEERLALVLDRLYNPRMAVAGIGDTDSTCEVTILIPIGIVDIDPFSALGLDLRQVGPNWREVFNGFTHFRFTL